MKTRIHRAYALDEFQLPTFDNEVIAFNGFHCPAHRAAQSLVSNVLRTKFTHAPLSTTCAGTIRP